MTLRIALVSTVAAAVVMLTGCGESRTALAAPFTGTWHQVAGATTGPTPDDLNSLGFVSFAAERVTANVAGGERGVFAITENISDPGLRTGRLLLDDGSELYLCAGHGFVDLPLADGRLLAPSSWLDLRWIRRDGRETNLRLWSGDALAAADLAKRAHERQPTIAVAAIAAAPASQPTVNPRDRWFIDGTKAGGDRFLTLAASELVAARNTGTDEQDLAGIYARISLASRGEMIALLAAARDGRLTALGDADRLHAGLERFDQAFREWLPAQR